MKDKKLFIHEAGASAVVIIVLSVIFFFMVLGSRKSWNNGLAAMTEKVLKDHAGAEYTIKGTLPVHSPLAVSAAVFELEKNTNGQTAPAKAVWICP